MRKAIVDEWMSLDGVVQAPGLPDEDRSGGFEHGGWHVRYFDEASQKWVVDAVASAGGYLLGRATYETLGAYWPNASEEKQAVAEPLKHAAQVRRVDDADRAAPVAERVAAPGDVAEAVTALKQEEGDDLHVIGSPKLAQTLVEHDLVDEFRLMIDPLLLGGGKRLFRDDGVRRPLRLVEHEVTTTEAILATHVPAQD